MKVTFTCEKCGYGHGYVNTDHAIIVDPESIWNRFVGTTCPNCAKLTYGPLTEDMIAEALSACSKSCNDVEDDYYECEARFILRLLIDGGLANDKPTVTRGCTAEDWREWLLDLARQK